MNERIRELARNADLNWHNHWNDDESNSLKKFAQLIVQECIDYCGENLSKTVGGALKIHFGVEE